MARNRQFKPPKEEFPEDEELAQGSLGRRGAAAKKGKKQSFLPEEDEQAGEVEEQRHPAKGGKSSKKPQKRQEDESEEDVNQRKEEPPSKKQPAKKGKQKAPFDEDEEPPPEPVAKKPVKGAKGFSKTKPPEDSEQPDEDEDAHASKKPMKGKKSPVKQTTDEEFQPEEAEPTKKTKGKKTASVMPTERETPRSSRPRGRLCSREKVFGWGYVGMNIAGVGAGVIALIFNWVKNDIVTYSLSKVTVDVLGTSATSTLQDVLDKCTSGCSNFEYYYATSIIMLVLGALGLLCALLKAVLMTLLMLRPGFAHDKLLKRALPASPALWVLGVAAMVVGFMKLKDDASDLTIDIGFGIAFGNVGLLAGNAVFGFFAVKKLFRPVEEDEEVQSTKH